MILITEYDEVVTPIIIPIIIIINIPIIIIITFLIVVALNIQPLAHLNTCLDICSLTSEHGCC